MEESKKANGMLKYRLYSLVYLQLEAIIKFDLGVI
jgi:hypothetical protein